MGTEIDVVAAILLIVHVVGGGSPPFSCRPIAHRLR